MWLCFTGMCRRSFVVARIKPWLQNMSEYYLSCKSPAPPKHIGCTIIMLTSYCPFIPYSNNSIGQTWIHHNFPLPGITFQLRVISYFLKVSSKNRTRKHDNMIMLNHAWGNWKGNFIGTWIAGSNRLLALRTWIFSWISEDDFINSIRINIWRLCHRIQFYM